MSSIDTYSIQMLVPHPLLLHLEKAFFGPYMFYGAAGPSGSAPFLPPPDYGFGTLRAPGTSTIAPLHTSQSDAPRHSAADVLAHTAAATIFGNPFGMSSIATTSLNPSLDTATTSLEATTLPENAYLTSNLWVGLHDWGERNSLKRQRQWGNGQ